MFLTAKVFKLTKQSHGEIQSVLKISEQINERAIPGEREYPFLKSIINERGVNWFFLLTLACFWVRQQGSFSI